MDKNNFAATIRVRTQDFVGIAEYLRDMGVPYQSMSQVLSTGIKLLNENLPEKYHCNSATDAYNRFTAIGNSGGLKKSNKLAERLRNQMQEEQKRSLADTTEDINIIHEISARMSKQQKVQTKLNTSELPEELIVSDSAKTKKSGLRINTDISDVPGNSIDIRAEMLRGGKDE